MCCMQIVVLNTPSSAQSNCPDAVVKRNDALAAWAITQEKVMVIDMDSIF